MGGGGGEGRQCPPVLQPSFCACTRVPPSRCRGQRHHGFSIPQTPTPPVPPSRCTASLGSLITYRPIDAAVPPPSMPPLQVYSIMKLLSPEGDHSHIAKQLADTLFGQGKVQEARATLKAAGLTRKGMKQNIPASYLR